MQFTVTDVLIIVAVVLVLDFIWSYLYSKLNRRDEAKRRAKANDVVKTHGLTMHYYLAGAGVEDADLHNALNYFSDKGYIVMDVNKQIVGRVASSTVPDSPMTNAVQVSGQQRLPLLKLVVDNSEN